MTPYNIHILKGSSVKDILDGWKIIPIFPNFMFESQSQTSHSSQDWNGLKSTAKTVEKPTTNAEQHWNLILWPQKCRVHKWNQICMDKHQCQSVT